MQSNSSLAGPTYLLVAIATLMLQLAIYDRQGPAPQEWIQLAIVMIVALVLRYKHQLGKATTGRVLSIVGFSVLMIVPLVWNAYGRKMGRFGCPFEMQIALCLRNMMIGLAAGGGDKRSKAFASLASCFLALFSLLWLMNYWTIALLIVYTIAGMWWLLGAYWSRLGDCFLTHSERAIPWKPAICAAALAGVVTLLMFPFVNGQSYTTAIEGFLPSSGGTGSQDEYAYGGVGDGPQMVAAKENASSFGPVESELFLESKMPSLYDAINEFSEPLPISRKRKRIKAIPLGSIQMQKNHQRRGMSQNAAREFSAVRKRKRKIPNVQDLRSRVLLQVSGRVPVHLGLCTYDRWDGHKLTSSNSARPIPMNLEKGTSDGKSWVRYDGTLANDALSYLDQHEIRVINLKTDRVPSPPNLRGIHIDRIHAKNFFDTTQDGMLAIDVDFIPQLTILHLESLRRRFSQIPAIEKRSEDAKISKNAVANLAHEWTEGIANGWPQIEAVCWRLQQEYTLDPEALVSQDVEDAAEYFLFDSKRGPNYLFATSAALLIQSLGYETRVVSGFYADSENYDHQSRLTLVYADDAHFWVEVLASPGGSESTGEVVRRDQWFTVEPSPGYQVLLAPESPWSKLLHRAARTWHAVKSRPVTALALVAFVVATWYKKADVIDLAITYWWRLHHKWGDVRYQVISTLRLLERRARVRGYPRPSALSLSKWNLSKSQDSIEAENWEVAFLSLANWALYGEGHSASYSRGEVNALCRTAATFALQPPKRRRHFSSSHLRGGS